MTEERIFPSEVITKFLEAQADNVQGNLKFLVTCAFHGTDFETDTDFDKRFQKLFDVEEIQVASRAVQVAALLDYYLMGPFDLTERVFEKMEEEGRELSPQFQKLKANAPEWRANFEKTAKDWAALRAGDLSISAIKDFEEWLFHRRLAERS